jgi:hypothetical protein
VTAVKKSGVKFAQFSDELDYSGISYSKIPLVLESERGTWKVLATDVHWV